MRKLWLQAVSAASWASAQFSLDSFSHTNTNLHVFGRNLSGGGPAVGVGKVPDLSKANTHTASDMQRHSGQLVATERQHKQTGCGTDENLCKATTVNNKYPPSTLHHRKPSGLWERCDDTTVQQSVSANQKWENADDNVKGMSWAASEPTQWAWRRWEGVPMPKK